MKHTPADYPIIPEIKDRWSPRSFAKTPISEFELFTLFEAARWAPSSMNEQPWRFIYGHKGDESFDRIGTGLLDGNSWAKEAQVLIVTVVRDTFTRNDKPNSSAQHDLGLAVANLSIQATAQDISLHQMGGIYRPHLIEALGIPDEYSIVTVIALGRRGAPDQLTDALKERELSERTRKPLNEFVFHGTFKEKEHENTIA